MEQCATGCGKSAELRCSTCKTVHYCGTECQKKDWKTHKKECSPPLPRPPTTHCTGCNQRFGGRDEVEVDQLCPDCGYTTCESCSCHHSRGTCYCQDSNFGHPYCDRFPQWYHFSQRTGRSYTGDNHPDRQEAEGDYGLPASAWEDAPRKCGNCGEVKLCLIPGYTRRGF